MEKKRININSIQPGMRAAENVFNSAGQMIVPIDSELTERAISRLRFHNILSIRVFVEPGVSFEQQETVPDTTSYFSKLRQDPEYLSYCQRFDACSAEIAQVLGGVAQGQPLPDVRPMITHVRHLLASCKTGIQLFDFIHCTRSNTDPTIAHSLNVALICGVLGSWLDYDTQSVEILTQCGLFHDIGKLTIDSSILDKKTKLTDAEFALIKSHPTRGYNLLRPLNVDKRVKLAALMHHERVDGSGYPLGVSEEQIDDFAKIVAIADVYEAMTSPRIYRDSHSPFSAVREFEKDGLAKFDPKFLLTFLEHLSLSYLGNKVRLSNGTIGTIIYINRSAYSRPMIHAGNDYIDLLKSPEITIDAIL